MPSLNPAQPLPNSGLVLSHLALFIQDRAHSGWYGCRLALFRSLHTSGLKATNMLLSALPPRSALHPAPAVAPRACAVEPQSIGLTYKILQPSTHASDHELTYRTPSPPILLIPTQTSASAQARAACRRPTHLLRMMRKARQNTSLLSYQETTGTTKTKRAPSLERRGGLVRSCLFPGALTIIGTGRRQNIWWLHRAERTNPETRGAVNRRPVFV